jgi:hypothetical protein
MTGELRNRKKQGKKSAKKEEAKKTRDAPPVEDDETIWSILRSHPLMKILPLLLVPYIIYRVYFFLRLQHPEYLGGLLRSGVGLTQERQLLVVGSLASGTAQSTASLVDTFGLEVAHETSDTVWNFARDGTVSWFHGVRFMPRPPDKEIFSFCINHKARSKAFHPINYRSTSDCNVREEWSKCWARECIKLLDAEWACGLSEDNSACETPFRATLYQVRHPLRTVESLLTNHMCVDGKLDGGVHPSFLALIKLMVPSLDETNDTCIEVAVKYVLAYNQAMLHAREQGFIAGMYQIEKVTPCKLAALAGLLAPSVVYEPNSQKVNSICSQPFSTGKDVILTPENQIDTDPVVTLTWGDLQGGMHGSNRTDNELELALKQLTIQLGYMIPITN